MPIPTNRPTTDTISATTNPTTITPVNTNTNAAVSPSANSSINPAVNRTANLPISTSNLPENPPAYTQTPSIENIPANVGASVVVNQSLLATQVNAISPSYEQPSAPASAPGDLPSYSQIA